MRWKCEAEKEMGFCESESQKMPGEIRMSFE